MVKSCAAAEYPSAQSEAVRLRGSKSAFSNFPTPLSRLRRQLPSLKEGSLRLTGCGAEKKKSCESFIFKNEKVDKGQKQPLSAIFPSRRLLSSRSRVTPSSRRKAMVECCSTAERKKCRLSGFENLNSAFISLRHKGKKSSTNTGSLREGAGAERLKD